MGIKGRIGNVTYRVLPHTRVVEFVGEGDSKEKDLIEALVAYLRSGTGGALLGINLDTSGLVLLATFDTAE